jgi:glucose/arabinose dehydrogenase
MRQFISLIIFILLTATSEAQVELEDAFPNLSSFSRPVDFQNAGDQSNRVFVVEQQGVIYVFENDPEVSERSVFLDIDPRVDDGGNEEGLLGLAFHPDYKSNGYFYVNYTAQNPNRTKISRFSVSEGDSNLADPDSEFLILEYLQPYSNHNGGQIAFGPDRMLYIATGDGGSGGDPQNNAQNLTNLLGKILRIDINDTTQSTHYTIPDTNPFITDSTRGEIYAYGLRNPWRFSFDAINGDLWTGDVGQNKYEEVDIIVNGGNYGWRIMEGTHCYNSDSCNETGIFPVLEYPHTNQNLSITGGYVYRGTSLPVLYGKYIYADYQSGRIWSFDASGLDTMAHQELQDTEHNISSFGVDEQNELYICTHSNQSSTRIYKLKITPVSHLEQERRIFPQDLQLFQNYPNPFNPATAIGYQLSAVSEVELSIFNIIGAKVAILVSAIQQPGRYEVQWEASGFPSGVYYYRLRTKRGFDQTRKLVLLK